MAIGRVTLYPWFADGLTGNQGEQILSIIRKHPDFRDHPPRVQFDQTDEQAALADAGAFIGPQCQAQGIDPSLVGWSQVPPPID